MPASPIVLAIILGPMAETNLRKAMLMYQGDWSFLYTRPITLVFLFLAVFSVVSSYVRMQNPLKMLGSEQESNS